VNRLLEWLRKAGRWLRPFFLPIPRVAILRAMTTSTERESSVKDPNND
jgi:hypothetical protein